MFDTMYTHFCSIECCKPFDSFQYKRSSVSQCNKVKQRKKHSLWKAQ